MHPFCVNRPPMGRCAGFFHLSASSFSFTSALKRIPGAADESQMSQVSPDSEGIAEPWSRLLARVDRMSF